MIFNTKCIKRYKTCFEISLCILKDKKPPIMGVHLFSLSWWKLLNPKNPYHDDVKVHSFISKKYLKIGKIHCYVFEEIFFRTKSSIWEVFYV